MRLVIERGLPVSGTRARDVVRQDRSPAPRFTLPSRVVVAEMIGNPVGEIDKTICFVGKDRLGAEESSTDATRRQSWIIFGLPT